MHLIKAIFKVLTPLLNLAPCSWARIFIDLFSKSVTFGSKSGSKSLVLTAKIVPRRLRSAILACKIQLQKYVQLYILFT